MHSLSLRYNYNKLNPTLLLQAPSLPWQIQSFLSLFQSPITIERDIQLLTKGRVLPDKSLPLASSLVFLSISFCQIAISNYHYMQQAAVSCAVDVISCVTCHCLSRSECHLVCDTACRLTRVVPFSVWSPYQKCYRVELSRGSASTKKTQNIYSFWRAEPYTMYGFSS